MSVTDIESLITMSRFPSFASYLPLVLYLPLGIALAVVRLFIFLHVALLFYILPTSFPFKSVILRIMLSVTGLPISTHGIPHPAKRNILIANHITNLDPFILAVLYPHILAVEGPFLSSVLYSIFSKKCALPADKNHSDILVLLKDTIRENDAPLLFFPERIKSNGKNKLLKFSILPFEVDTPIQPIVIQAHRYIFDINISTHKSSVYTDLLWCFILPVSLFTVKFLPVTERKKDESTAEFTSRVESNMAKSLGVSTSTSGHHEVTQFLKNKANIAVEVGERSKCQVTGQVDPELERMFGQVKDVLPDTPTHLIWFHLKQTKDVDTTITNILEGKDTAEACPLPQSFKASKFEAAASARQLSFAERKQVMLDTARLKYRIKHGLE
ncbi:lipid droplet-regulating VLDL assembly factor AUP1-like [Physella acuta]|uniref:lipid droplet-regulating VLDL assembly factor AUP1-like n=1 Tax=Physella acuta TaxID=109671 RepID=UPI0027DB8B73|nr:lipid droplet-regulating VLDL assembly factor AUP1-like [Physella acuta]